MILLFRDGSNMVSILILVYNAKHYVKALFDTLPMTEGINYETVVVDNASGKETAGYLRGLHSEGKINKLVRNKENLFFSKGNNIAAQNASLDSNLFLLLNSDVKIINKWWLKYLVETHLEGATAYGTVSMGRNKKKIDGYCMLTDAWLYNKFLLDVSYPFLGAVTKYQGELISSGYNVVGIEGFKCIIHARGGSHKYIPNWNKGLIRQQHGQVHEIFGDRCATIVKCPDLDLKYGNSSGFWAG